MPTGRGWMSIPGLAGQYRSPITMAEVVELHAYGVAATGSWMVVVRRAGPGVRSREFVPRPARVP